MPFGQVIYCSYELTNKSIHSKIKKVIKGYGNTVIP